MLVDVMEKRPNSPFINFIDIDWCHARERINGLAPAPFLGQYFGRTLEEGEIQLQFGSNGLQVGYYDQAAGSPCLA